VAPLNGRAQRLVAGRSGALAARQQAEAIVEVSQDLIGGEHSCPGRRQLDGQGNAIQTPADLRDRRGVVVGHDEAGPHGLQLIGAGRDVTVVDADLNGDGSTPGSASDALSSIGRTRRGL